MTDTAMTSLRMDDGRTAADAVFDELYRRIRTLELLPNDRISQVEVSSEFRVSQQPVRDAFSRLSKLGYLAIRPKKATIIQPFSLSAISNARFIRMAIEAEIVRVLASASGKTSLDALEKVVDRQSIAVDRSDVRSFYDLDNEFHFELCHAAEREAAFATIIEMKAQVDRLCMLSLKHDDEMKILLNDHRSILQAISSGNPELADHALREHLGRLDRTIADIEQQHGEYFVP